MESSFLQPKATIILAASALTALVGYSLMKKNPKIDESEDSDNPDEIDIKLFPDSVSNPESQNLFANSDH
jgi:hypothetical protein